MSKINIGLSALVFYLFSLKVYSKQSDALVIKCRKNIIKRQEVFNMKKFLALILAGVMVVSMSVMVFAEGDADASPDGSFSEAGCEEQPDTAPEEEEVRWLEISNGEISYDECKNDTEREYWLDMSKMYPDRGYFASGSSASSGGGGEVYDRGSEAAALAAEASGIPMATSIAASEENKSVGEYMNNAVVAAPGLENAVPISQGGNVIINGAPSNQTFSVLKVLSGHTDSAKAQAASLGGTVLNVARIDASVYFDTATVNFYMPGVTAGQNIQVYQYDYTNGQWTGVAVAEVREDHVVVDMTSLGVLAFFEVPAAE